MYRPAGYTPPRTGPRIGEWLSEAFTLFGREWQTWVLQGLIFLFLGMGPMLIGVGAYYAGMLGTVMSSSRNSEPSPMAIGGMLASMGAFLVGSLVSMFLMVYFMAGMKRTAAKQLRGERIEARDIFSAGDVYLSLLGATILVGLAVSIGAFFCVVPGLLIAGLLSFTLPIIVEERIGVGDAMRKSWEATQPFMWMFLLWYFLVSLLGGLGAYACYVGYAVTFPIYTLAMMIAYRDTFGLPGALPPANAVPAAPTQDPGVNYGPAGPPVAGASCPACGKPVAVGAVMCPHCHASIPGGYTGPSGG